MKKALAVLVSGIFVSVLFVGAAFAQPAGKAIVDNVCSKCHNTERIYKANKKPAEWEATVEKMTKKGAKVKPEEKDTILKYLNTLNK